MRDVGIVMPVYKQNHDYLKLALKSVLEQSFTNYYFAVVSDGAPSDHIEIIKRETEGDERVHLIEKEKNEGIAKALNTGFNYLQKFESIRYLTWVSSDNVYDPEFIEKHRNALENAPENVGLSYSNFYHIDHKGTVLREQFSNYQGQPKETLLDICFIGASFMYKSKAAAKTGGYQLWPVEDYEYWLRLTEHCDIVYIPEVLAAYRVDSPLSVSAQLRHSKEQHRRFRHALNLAKLEARKRRNIPCELTVIYPVSDGSLQTVDQLERLLEQTFSNYQITALDTTPDQSASEALKAIEDPRLTFLHLPGASEDTAILTGIQNADAPLAMLYGKGAFPSNHVMLNRLFHYYLQYKARGAEAKHIVFFVNDNGHISHRAVIPENEPAFSQIYHTETLADILKK
ncbi:MULTISPECIES: glycosyltransferase family 2 protein [Bacillus]|nr:MULTISPECIES: glycosyltransferase family A protein [Bacillus]KKB71537.1 hypothetical protein TH62_22595 [Bacillus sp. TH008]MDU0073651.1 glycosyltransferase family A protein [Bacillus sp. IG6]MED8021523.1 glycosyltransferase family A protein [Bacillus glycinifermentans]WKB78165.1 glycosyltransferase family A protein [Bacillus glycinifermentans]SCA84649.1 glycosyltransferase [Bacillus glycinifermentans]